MKITDIDHPFYRPLWRRVAIVAAVAAWTGFEFFVAQSGLWSALAAGMLAYAAWTFLIAWPKPPEQQE